MESLSIQEIWDIYFYLFYIAKIIAFLLHSLLFQIFLYYVVNIILYFFQLILYFPLSTYPGALLHHSFVQVSFLSLFCILIHNVIFFLCLLKTLNDPELM